MPDIPFGGPGRLYDDSPAESAAFPASAPVAAGKAAGVVHADDATAAEKAPPETTVVEPAPETEKPPTEAAPETVTAPEEAH